MVLTYRLLVVIQATQVSVYKFHVLSVRGNEATHCSLVIFFHYLLDSFGRLTYQLSTFLSHMTNQRSEWMFVKRRHISDNETMKKYSTHQSSGKCKSPLSIMASY